MEIDGVKYEKTPKKGKGYALLDGDELYLGDFEDGVRKGE